MSEAATLEDLHKRAGEAERRLSALEANMTGGSGSAAASTPHYLVDELVSLRKMLAAALEEAEKTEALNKQVLEENAALKAENTKQAYRIDILTTSVRELQKASDSKSVL